MKIIEVPIEQLKPAEYNPRFMTEKQAKELEKSIKEFGLVDPLIVNRHKGRENIVIGGHQRFKIASNLGFKTVPVVYVDLDEKKERELNLRLNKNLGDWDWDLLANFEIEELKEVGFSDEELDKFIGLEEDDFDAEAEYEKILEPTTKLGDLWQLGEHRLLCGDSTQKASYEALLGQKKASLVFTDPPYNVGYDYTVTYVKGRARKNKFHTFNDNKNEEEFKDFIFNVFNNCYQFSLNSACFYCWHASKTEYLFRLGIEMAAWYIAQTLHWLKNGTTFSRGLDYLYANEPCYYGWKRGEKHFNNKKAVKDFKNIIALDINDFKDLPNIWYENRDKIKEYGHPTQKPIRLAERALKKHSKQGDIILEPFNGSGSTMMACGQLKRKCYAIELDPKYVDVAIKRWELFTNNKAIKLTI